MVESCEPPKGLGQDREGIGVQQVCKDHLDDIFSQALTPSRIQLQDWYKFTRSDIEKSNMRGILRHYSSLEHALQEVYREYPWNASKFARVYLADLNNQRDLLESIAKKLGIKQVRGGGGKATLDIC